MKREHLLGCALVCVPLCLGASVQATSGSPVNPFDGVESVAIEIDFGGGLTLEPSIAVQLFGGDTSRAKRFRQQLVKEASTELAEAGVAAYTAQDDSANVAWISATFYGRPSAAKGSAEEQYVFLAIFSVWRDTRTPPEDSDCDDREWLRYVLGVASGSDLEQEMRTVFLRVLKELLEMHRDSEAVSIDAPGG